MAPSNGAEATEVNTWSDQQTAQVQYEAFRVHGSSDIAEVAGTWGYRRCLDFDANGSRGQDFCAVRGGGGYVVGIVADGVSQSYYGDIAAQEVSLSLVDYLWQQRATPPPDRDIEKKLLSLAHEVDLLVQQKRPTNPTLEEALAPVRERNGSQTVFAAFVLDFRGQRRNLTLYQVGDIFTWIFDREHGRKVGADPNGRWASRGRSDLRLQTNTYVDVTGIVIHSDGLRPGWAAELTEPCVSLHSFEAEAGERAKVDDLSFIAIEIRPPFHSSHQKTPAVKTVTASPRDTTCSSVQKATTGVIDPPSVSQNTDLTKMSGRSEMVGVSIKRHWRMHWRLLVGGFVAGLVTGGSAVLLVFVFFFRTSAEKTAEESVKPGKGETPASMPFPGSDPQVTAPVKTLKVAVAQLPQKIFLDRFGVFPEKRNPQDGEVIAHIELQIEGTSSLKISADPAKEVQVRECHTGRGCFLAYLPGPATQNKVVFEVVDGAGAILSGQALLPGRQPKEVGGNRFLGYYDIHLSPAGKSGGNS